MRCEDTDKLIHLFLDGRIDETRKEELEKHLSTCKRCKEKLSLLESLEKVAKGIKTPEPSQEYWDTFSSRVRERIVAQKEESFSAKLENAFENILTLSPLKVRIAAGVVSIVLVLIVGKLYMDYQGKKIIPSQPRTKSLKAPALSAPELMRDSAIIEREAGKIRYIPDESKESEAPQITSEEFGKMGAPIEEKVKKGDEVIPRSVEIKTGVAPSIIPEEKVTPDMAETTKRVLSPETYQTGAGKEEGKAKEKEVSPEHKAKDLQMVPLKEITSTAAREPVVLDRTLETTSVQNYYAVDDKKIPRVEEGDTLLQEKVLRTVIDSWNRYIEKNPEDSLANEGYRQVAIAYYLLSRLTQEESDLSTGIELLEKYENQVTDPEAKKQLNKRLKQLEALKEK